MRLMNGWLRLVTMIGLVAVMGMLIAACGDDDSTSAETSTPTIAATATVTVAPPTPSPAPPAATATPEGEPVLTTVEVVRALTPSVTRSNFSSRSIVCRRSTASSCSARPTSLCCLRPCGEI